MVLNNSWGNFFLSFVRAISRIYSKIKKNNLCEISYKLVNFMACGKGVPKNVIFLGGGWEGFTITALKIFIIYKKFKI